MVHTMTYNPCGYLKNYIKFYAFREFDCLDAGLLKPMPATHEVHMMFTLNCKMQGFNNSINNRKPFSIDGRTSADCVFAGLLSSMQGAILFKGRIRLLTIQFKPTGFYRIFGMPPSIITNCLGHSAELLSKEIGLLHEQLETLSTPTEMFILVEKFISERLRMQKTRYEDLNMTKVTEFLICQPGHYSIEKLASFANMSLKTFERKFVEQVGLSPKLFERIKRFNNAMDLKLYHPQLNWTQVGNYTGYYDQMHLIKDFTAFTNKSPSLFFKHTPPLLEIIQQSNG